MSSDPRIDQSANGSPKESFRPYVPDEQVLPELTWFPLVMGSLLGIIFGASSMYLVLKVGLTVSASIPVAVLSITLFRNILGSLVYGARRSWRTTSSKQRGLRESRWPLVSG